MGRRTDPRTVLGRRDLLKLAGIATVPLLFGCAPEAPATPASAPQPTPAPAATAAPAATSAPAAPTSAATPAAQAAQIKRGGTIVESIQWTYPTLDPHLTTVAQNPAYDAMFSSLIRFDLVDWKTGQFKIVGDLADSWEQPDAKTVVFKLKQGVKFHDGSDFDASVAAWNFLRGRDHPKSQFKLGFLAGLDKAEAVDKNTLKLSFKSPNAALLPNLASPYYMASKASLDKLGDEASARQPVGTGPFRFKQWITDDRVIMDKNPDYFVNGADGKPLPYIDQFVSRFVPDPTVALVDVRSGTQQILESIPASVVDIVKADPNLAIQSMPWGGTIYFEVSFNTTSGPFKEVLIRQAAEYGIDRDGMAKALGFGIASPQYYPEWAPSALGYDESILKYQYDPAKVKELLTKAGYPNGIDVELKVIAREPENTIGEFAQQMWSAVGIRTKLITLERTAWIDAVRANQFQACFWRGNIVSTTTDPDLLKASLVCGGANNWGQWCDKDIDALMAQGATELDRNTRNDIYKKALTIIQEKAYLADGIIIPLMTVYRKEVQDLEVRFQIPVVRASWLKS